MRQHFATEQWLPFPPPLVFAFFANPQNLPPLMPAWQRARIDEVTLRPAPPRPPDTPSLPGIAAGNGTELLITALAGPGLPLRLPWLARIEDFHWDDHFCDVQVNGPFAYWRHCHSVQKADRKGKPGTAIRDEVTYELPLAPLSRIAAPLGRLAMRAMFATRQRQAEGLVAAYAQRAGKQAP